MTYLELCQRAARESGTIPGDNTPSTVVGQSGRLRKLIDWVATAYTDIQTEFNDWRWMQGTYSGSVTQSNPTYTGASFGLSRFNRWIATPHQVTIYETPEGVADESELTFRPWDDFRRLYDRGTQLENRPIEYTITPAGEIRLGPVPGASYTLRGPYQKSAQILAANSDTPEMPSDYHMMIVWDALLLLGGFDEGAFTMQEAQRRRQDIHRRLIISQRPSPMAGGSFDGY